MVTGTFKIINGADEIFTLSMRGGWVKLSGRTPVESYAPAQVGTSKLLQT
jgi:hypothetical protein